MATRAQLLKANPLTVAARTFMERNAINPDRVDIGTLRAEPIGDKSVQVRAEVMLTMPAADFYEGLQEAQEKIDAEAEEARQALLDAASTGPAVTVEEAEQVGTLGEQLGIEPGAADDDGEGF